MYIKNGYVNINLNDFFGVDGSVKSLTDEKKEFVKSVFTKLFKPILLVCPEGVPTRIGMDIRPIPEFKAPQYTITDGVITQVIIVGGAGPTSYNLGWDIANDEIIQNTNYSA